MLLSPEEIVERRKAIRFPPKEHAIVAGLAEHIAVRTLNRRQRPTFDNVAALSKALTAEEIRLRDYLIGLHPLTVPAAQDVEAGK